MTNVRMTSLFYVFPIFVQIVYTSAASIMPGSRIVGGNEVQSETKYPFIVSLHHRNIIDWVFCGGTIIRRDWILTAAHCLTGLTPYDIVVIAGVINLKNPTTDDIKDTRAIFIHELYHTKHTENDLGLILLKKPLELSSRVQVVKLPYGIFNIWLAPHNLFDVCSVAGWGRLDENNRTHPNTLREVELKLISNEECERKYMWHFTNQTVCTLIEEGGKDACMGDSGGPLVCENYLIGVVSWGLGCARPHTPGVYMRVDTYLDWMDYIISINLSNHIKNNAVILFLIKIL